MQLNKILNEVGPEFENNAEVFDRENQFAESNFMALKERGVYKAVIPKDLGGGGASYAELCHFLFGLAKHCPSTALTLSMHQHLLCVLLYKHLNGDEASTKILKKVAAEDLILLSTGGGDWISSNGSSEKVDGGYRINCKKYFCSGSPIADVAVTSCIFNDGQQDKVIHFSVPLNSEGIVDLNDWNAMGMRGTGSNSMEFNNVFIPEERVSLIRERGKWHPIWDTVVTYAFPVFIAPYAGIAEAITEKTVQLFSKLNISHKSAIGHVGKMHNHYRVSQMAIKEMIDGVGNFQLIPSQESASCNLQNKVIVTHSARKCAQAAMQAIGGYAYCQGAGVERLYRDVFAGQFHPLHSSEQAEVMGNYLVNGFLIESAEHEAAPAKRVA